jgi:hypothetical protein
MATGGGQSHTRKAGKMDVVTKIAKIMAERTQRDEELWNAMLHELISACSQVPGLFDEVQSVLPFDDGP